jgi:hypothetical protein
MAGLTYHLSAELEGEEPYEITADQRDIAAWELEPFGCAVALSGHKIYSFTRYLAWHASKRINKTKLSWQKWSDVCVNVTSLDLEEGDESGDPGQPAPSAATS